MPTPELRLIAPQSCDWGAFDCGDARINMKLIREARRAQAGLQRLYGVLVQDHLAAVMTLQAGHLRAPVSILASLGMGEIEVPTLHIEVLAVRKEEHRQGHGEMLMLGALGIGSQLMPRIGLKTVSLEATAESRAFYLAQGLQCADSPWTDGSWPMWFVLS